MKKEIISIVESALAEKLPFILLRGDDDFARPEGDLDFMVRRGHALKACHLVIDAASARGWFLIGVRKISYLATIVLIKPDSVAGDESIKIDFFDGLNWYGIGEDQAGDKLFHYLAQNPTHKTTFSIAASFFQKALIVGQVSEKDWMRATREGCEEKDLTHAASVLDLSISSSQIHSHGVKGLPKWRYRASTSGADTPSKFLLWLIRALLAHIKFKSRLGRKSGLILSFSGLDGSGKSTLVDRLLRSYESAGDIAPVHIHLLPKWIPFPHQIFRRKKTVENYSRPYSEPPVASRLSSFLRLSFYTAAFFFSKCYAVYLKACGNTVIYDRSFFDFGVDLTRARMRNWEIPVALHAILNISDCLFFINASPDTVVKRKNELSLNKAQELQASYLTVAEKLKVHVIDGDLAPDAVFTLVLNIVSKSLSSRLAKSI